MDNVERRLQHEMTDEKFLAAFEACTFPLDNFHHREHIKVAYLYLLRYPLEETAAKIRAGLQAFAAANKAPENDLERGYPETTTQAWVRLVHVTLCEYGPGESAD